MPTIPKYLQRKEYFDYTDVISMSKKARSSLEDYFSEDTTKNCSENYMLQCTFNSCGYEIVKFRQSESLKKIMRSHILDHISKMKDWTEDQKEQFLTKNEMYKQLNQGTGKQKKPQKSQGSTSSPTASKYDHERESMSCFTRIKDQADVISSGSALENVPPVPGVSSCLSKDEKQNELTDDALNVHPLIDEMQDHLIDDETNTNPMQDEMREQIVDEINGSPMKGDAEDHLIDAEINGNPICTFPKGSKSPTSGSEVTSEADSCHSTKEQETYMYKLAMNIFNTKPDRWEDPEALLDELVESADYVDALSDEEQHKILAAFEQYKESLELGNKVDVEKMREPLSVIEEETLNEITKETWDSLLASTDPVDKEKLQEYANLLLRQYEGFPRKSKPKTCKHCGKTYTASTSLHSHLVSISGIRFWRCSRCKDANKGASTFTRKHSLIYHIIKENDIPRYICSCGQTHNHTHHQRCHARQHAEEKRMIQCNIEKSEASFLKCGTNSQHMLQAQSLKQTRNDELREICPSGTSEEEKKPQKASERRMVKRPAPCDETEKSCPSETSKRRKIDKLVSTKLSEKDEYGLHMLCEAVTNQTYGVEYIKISNTPPPSASQTVPDEKSTWILPASIEPSSCGENVVHRSSNESTPRWPIGLLQQVQSCNENHVKPSIILAPHNSSQDIIVEVNGNSILKYDHAATFDDPAMN